MTRRSAGIDGVRRKDARAADRLDSAANRSVSFRNTGADQRTIVSAVSDGAEFVVAVSSEGQRVLEAELLNEHEIAHLIVKARAVDAELLWLHCDLDLTAHGFERFPGYVRMRTEQPPQGVPLPRLEPEFFASTLDGSYRGLWGHKLVRDNPRPPPDAIVLGLCGEGGEPIGLCVVDPAERFVDGPGVRQGSRVAGAYERLLLAACAELGAGPVVLDSWGDSPVVIDAYQAIGFEVVECTTGWQLPIEK